MPPPPWPLAARPLHIPYTVALVVVGTALGLTRWVEPPPLTKGLLFTAFLPGLVFEAAFHLELKPFLRNKLVILGLAVPGVIASVFLIALPLSRLPHFARLGFTGALLFAAIVVAIVRFTRGAAHWRWTIVAAWSGLRGALEMTLRSACPPRWTSAAWSSG